MANWIKPEKSTSNLCLVDLDKVFFISDDIICKARDDYPSIKFHSENDYEYWTYANKEDMLHDWNRIEEKLGLKCV